MLNIENILAMWKEDSKIDELRLDQASIDSAKLHSKYLELLTTTKLQLKRKDMEFKVLLKQKWLWYNGKLTKDQIGLKVMKGDMSYYYDSDPHIQEMDARLEYIKVLKDTLEEIIQNIRWRHSSIKNAIDWRKFESGA